jgi:hypothetical protein
MLGNHPLSAVRYCFFNVFEANFQMSRPFHLQLEESHAVVTGTRITRSRFTKHVWNISAKKNRPCSSDQLYVSNHVTAVNISGCNVCCVDFHCLTVSNISSKTHAILHLHFGTTEIFLAHCILVESLCELHTSVAVGQVTSWLTEDGRETLIAAPSFTRNVCAVHSVLQLSLLYSLVLLHSKPPTTL